MRSGPKKSLDSTSPLLSITMSQSTGAYIEEVEENVENGQNDEGDSHGEDQEQPQASSSSAPAPGGGKKKKKKKSKISKLLQPGGEIPQQLVNHVVNEVQAKHGAGTEGTDEASVRALLEQLKIIDVLKGKSGLGGKNRKDMGEHKVSVSDSEAVSWALERLPAIHQSSCLCPN